jgi:hypothetical protein
VALAGSMWAVGSREEERQRGGAMVVASSRGERRAGRIMCIGMNSFIGGGMKWVVESVTVLIPK